MGPTVKSPTSTPTPKTKLDIIIAGSNSVTSNPSRSAIPTQHAPALHAQTSLACTLTTSPTLGGSNPRRPFARLARGAILLARTAAGLCASVCPSLCA